MAQGAMHIKSFVNTISLIWPLASGHHLVVPPHSLSMYGHGHSLFAGLLAWKSLSDKLRYPALTLTVLDVY